jgi:CHASE3 domain sensor protein
MRFKINSVKNFLLSIIYILLVAGAFLSYNRIDDLIKVGDLVTYTNIVKLKLKELRADVKEGVSAMRGYLITKDSSFIKTYNEAKVNTTILLKQLYALTADKKMCWMRILI